MNTHVIFLMACVASCAALNLQHLSKSLFSKYRNDYKPKPKPKPNPPGGGGPGGLPGLPGLPGLGNRDPEQLSDRQNAVTDEESDAPKIGGDISTDDQCQGTEYDNFLYDPEDTCKYYECENNAYEHKSCPNGMSVNDGVYGDHKYKGMGLNPCTKRTNECKTTKSQLGLDDKDVRICGIDLCFVIDISCSITDKNKKLLKAWVLSMLNKLTIHRFGTLISGLAFSENTYHIMTLKESRKRPTRAKKIFAERFITEPDSCGTATWKALREVNEFYFDEKRLNGDRSGDDRKDRLVGNTTYRNVMIFATDGNTYPASDRQLTIRAGQDLKARGDITSHVVTLPNSGGKPPSKAEMEAIASTPDNIYPVGKFEDLEGRIKDILDAACGTI